MIFSHFWSLITEPDTEWNSVRQKSPSLIRLYLGQVVWLAALPALCTFIGTTQMGWSLPGSDHVVKLTFLSASWMAVLAWLATMSGVAVMGGFIHWMSQNFDSDPTLTECTAFSCYIAFPLFLAGIFGLYPSIWVAISAGTAAASISAYLLFTGLPAFMRIPKEQGFIYSSSVLCVGLVVLVSIMVITVLFWGMGVGPEYIQHPVR